MLYNELSTYPIGNLRGLADSMINMVPAAQRQRILDYLTDGMNHNFPNQLRDPDSIPGRQFHVELIQGAVPTTIYYNLMTGPFSGDASWAVNSANEKDYFISIILAVQNVLGGEQNGMRGGYRRRASRKARKTRKARKNRKHRV